MAEIKIDYDNCERQIKELKQAEGEYKTLLKTLDGVIADLPSGWSGTSADEARLIFENMKKEFKSLSTKTESTRKNIQMVVKVFKNAENKLMKFSL